MSEPYQELEERFAAFIGYPHAVSCSSGTAGLHLALLALGVGPGDEVIVPDFTMAAVAFAVSYTGATPMFADVDLVTYGMEYRHVERLASSRTKAIILVHTYGRLAADRALIFEYASRHGIPVIEDASEAHGAIPNSPADIAVYSLYRNKIIHAEEGGIVMSHNIDCATRMRYLKNMAFGPEHDFFHRAVGYNYRMANAQALIALESMLQYPENAARRREVESWYMQALPSHLSPRDAVWFYETRVADRATALKAHEGVRDSFKPLSSFPMYGGGPGMPNSRTLSESMVLLPVRPDMTRAEAEYIASKI